jgi:hypothetical protein
MPTAEQTKHDLATAFVTALSTKDWEVLRGVLAPDVTWTLPGDNQISGTAHGAQAVIDRAALIASYGLNFALQHVLVSRDNMALSLHNTRVLAIPATPWISGELRGSWFLKT